MSVQEDIKSIPPYAAVLEQLFGDALSEVEITHCEFTSRGYHFEMFEDEGGLGSMHSEKPPQEVVVEGVVTGSMTPMLHDVFQRCDAQLSHHLSANVADGCDKRFTIRRVILAGTNEIDVTQLLPPPQPTLDAAVADPTFQELPEPEQEAAGRFLGRVDESEPAQVPGLRGTGACGTVRGS